MLGAQGRVSSQKVKSLRSNSKGFVSVRTVVDLTNTLATAARSLRGLLPFLDRGLHVVTAALELPENALGGHLALEVLDRTLEATLTNVNFDGLALYGFDHERFCSF